MFLCLCLLTSAALAEQTAQDVRSRLAQLGYCAQNADDSEVTEGVRNFQRANGLSVTGNTEPTTLEKLFSEDAVSKRQYLEAFWNPAAVECDMKRGDSGDRVTKLQQILSGLGYYTNEPNGVYDEATVRAVALFQAVNGFAVNGRTQTAEASLLKSGAVIPAAGFESLTVLNVGSTGMAVKSLQKELEKLGYFKGACTGMYGKRTAEAVRALQEDNGLAQDGVWDIYMTACLNEGMYWQRAGAETGEEMNVLVPGSEGYLVKETETELSAAGYFMGTPDSTYDDATSVAVQQFQEANGLLMTGEADGATRALLSGGKYVLFADYSRAMAENALEIGDFSYGAYLLTARLAELGYPLTPSWEYNNDAALMITMFQTASEQTADGYVSADLRRYFNSKEAQTYGEMYVSYQAVMDRETIRRRLKTVIDTALDAVGKPYSAGKTGPEEFGVGGFVYYCFHEAGTELAPTTALQYENASKDENFETDLIGLQSSDLVFLRSGENMISAVYTDNGCMVFATPDEGCVVKLTLTEALERYEFVGCIGCIS